MGRRLIRVQFGVLYIGFGFFPFSVTACYHVWRGMLSVLLDSRYGEVHFCVYPKMDETMTEEVPQRRYIFPWKGFAPFPYLR